MNWVVACVIFAAIVLPFTSSKHVRYSSNFKGVSFSPAIVTSARATCPCDFLVSTSFDAPNFDILTIPSKKLQENIRLTDLKIPFDTRLSLFNLSSEHAYQRSLRQNWHQVHIPTHDVFTLVLRLTNPSTDGASSKFDLRILPQPIVRQNSNCPARLPQQPPKPSRRDVPASATTSGESTSSLVRTILSSWLPPNLTPYIANMNSLTESASLETSRIVGGNPGNEDLANYMVAFITRSDPTSFSLCSGTLVSPTTAITAAHCNIGPSTSAIVGRSSGVRQGKGTRVGVSDFTRHPNFDPLVPIVTSSRFDIAYATFTSEVPSTSKFMKVNVNASIPRTASVVRNAGYGRSSVKDDESNPSQALYQVDSPVVPNLACLNSYGSTGDVGFNPDLQMCAGYLRHNGCGSW